MKQYRVAVIGCRARGPEIARGYAAHPRTEVVALCDLKQDLLHALGDELSVSARYTDLDRMMAEARPDIAVIATGTEFHYPLLLRVLEYGCHIDVEKPLCQDLEQADEILARARTKGVKIAVHHQGRVGISVRAARRAIAEGRIGQVRALIASDKGYYGGYGLMNIGTHLINNMLGLVGHCRSVAATATAGGRPITPEDVVVAAGGMGIVAGESITATLDLDGGVPATLLLHRFPQVDGIAYGIEILGTEGRILWKSLDAWCLPTPHFVPDGEHDRWEPLPIEHPACFDPAGGARPDEVAYAEEFVAALDEGREHECGGIEGHHVLEVMMGILESAAYGARVDLPQPRRDHPLLRWRREAGLGAPTPGPRDYAAWLAAEDARLAK